MMYSEAWFWNSRDLNITEGQRPAEFLLLLFPFVWFIDEPRRVLGANSQKDVKTLLVGANIDCNYKAQQLVKVQLRSFHGSSESLFMTN